MVTEFRNDGKVKFVFEIKIVTGYSTMQLIICKNSSIEFFTTEYGIVEMVCMYVIKLCCFCFDSGRALEHSSSVDVPHIRNLAATQSWQPR